MRASPRRTSRAPPYGHGRRDQQDGDHTRGRHRHVPGPPGRLGHGRRHADLYREYTSTGTVQGASAVGLTALLQRRTGQVNVKAVDAFDAPVPNVQFLVNIEGQTISAITGATGEAVLAGVPTADVSVQAAATGFLPEPSKPVTVVESPAVSLEFALDRKTEPAGGIVTPRPNTPPPPRRPTADRR